MVGCVLTTFSGYIPLHVLSVRQWALGRVSTAKQTLGLLISCALHFMKQCQFLVSVTHPDNRCLHCSRIKRSTEVGTNNQNK